jgi:hypothetical protein
LRSITDLRSLNLFFPPTRIGLGTAKVFRTTMPKTAVNEDTQALTANYDVCLAFKVRDGADIQPESHTSFEQCASEQSFRSRI